MKIKTDSQRSHRIASSLRALLRGAIISVCALAPLVASTLTLTSLNIAHTDITGGFQGIDSSNNGLAWTGLTVVSNGQDTINLLGTFTCTKSDPCLSSTIKFNFTGAGFNIGQTELGSLTGTTTGNYQGNFNYSNLAVDPLGNIVINAGGINGAFSLSGTPGPLLAGSFAGQGNFYVASVPGGTVLTLSGTGAQITFAPVPEPATAPLMAGGLLILAGLLSYFKRSSIVVTAIG
jgi:hypothetical protein